MARKDLYHKYLRPLIIIGLILYLAGVGPDEADINHALQHPMQKLIPLVVIVAVAYYDKLIGILLAIAYLTH